MNDFLSLFTNPFLGMGLLIALASSIASGVIGSYVVVKRIVFISGSIAHSVLGGMGLCIWLRRMQNWEWLSPIYGAIVAALLSAIAIGWVHLRYREREDTVIAAIWSTGMSLGVIFVSLTPGYNVELMNYLFGNILWASTSDLALLVGLDLFLIAMCWLFHQKFLAICFDEQQASLQKVSVKATYLLLLCLVALSVILLIQVVGAILVIAMLTIPAAIASSLTHKLSRVMIFAVVIGCFFSLFGTALSYQVNWPPGSTISLTAALFYLGTFLVKRNRLY